MTDDQIQTLRKRAKILRECAGAQEHEFEGRQFEVEAEAIDALLALTERRCGNCGHWMKVVDDNGACHWKHQMMSRKAADGCLLGWVAKP